MRVHRDGDLDWAPSASPGAGGALGSPVKGELTPHVRDNQTGALVASDDLFPRRSINTDYVSMVSGSFLATQSKRNQRQWSNGAPDKPTDPNLLLQGHEDARNWLARIHPTVTGRNEGSCFSTANGKTIQAQIPSPRISNAFFLALPGVKHMLHLPDKTCTVCLVPKQGLEHSKRPGSRSRSCLPREVPEKGFYFCKSLKGTVRKVTM